MHQIIPDGTDYHQVFSAIGILAVTVLAFLHKSNNEKSIEQKGVEDSDHDPRH